MSQAQAKPNAAVLAQQSWVPAPFRGIRCICTAEFSGPEVEPELCCVCAAELGASEGGPAGRHWVLDPIDGTRGFVGMRQYAVCLGMLQDGRVELGVLGCPNLPQVCVCARLVGGACRCTGGAVGVRMRGCWVAPTWCRCVGRDAGVWGGMQVCGEGCRCVGRGAGVGVGQ